MTANPKCVSVDDSALDALEMMVDNRFRHLPVLNEEGCVVGLLDIAKCLYEAISALEKVHESDENKPDSAVAMAGVMATAMSKAAGGKGNKAQIAAMQMMMEQMFGGSMPTLKSIIGDHAPASVSSRSNVR